MRIAGGVVALIAGIFGCIAAVVTLFFGGVGAALSAHGAGTVIGLGWGGLFFSFVVIVLGACVIGFKSRAIGWLLILSAVAGAILGGTIVAVCMALALVGGILSLIGARTQGAVIAANQNVTTSGVAGNSLAFCSSCGKELQTGAAFCQSCGAKQSAIPSTAPFAAPALPRSGYSSYDQVPWYRKNWFAILCFFIFSPVLLIVLVTGDVFYPKAGQVKKYSTAAKGFLIAYCALAILVVIGSGIRSGHNASSGTQETASSEATPAEPDSPIQQLIKAQPADISATGELAQTFAFGGDATDLQRDNLLAKIKGQVVQWKLPVYDVKKTDDGYQIQTNGSTNILSAGSGPVGTFSNVTPLNDQDRALIASLKTGDYVTVKGVISDVTMRNVDLDPAILVVDNGNDASINTATTATNGNNSDAATAAATAEAAVATGAGNTPPAPAGSDFEDGSGIKYQFAPDATGGTLTSASVTIHLGKACDASSSQLGSGTWEWGNGGFVAHFPNNKDVGFPRQEIDIQNKHGCSNEPGDEGNGADNVSASISPDMLGTYRRYLFANGVADNDGSATITVTQPSQGQLSIGGSAEFGSNSGAPNIGDVDGILQSQGSVFAYNKDGCAFTLALSNGQLVVSNDNGGCGGLNVSFNGSYRKQMAQAVANASAQLVASPQASSGPQSQRPLPKNTRAAPNVSPAQQLAQGKLEAANECYESKNYDCSIQLAKSILSTKPGDRRAADLLQRSQDAQNQALHGSWNVQ